MSNLIGSLFAISFKDAYLFESMRALIKGCYIPTKLYQGRTSLSLPLITHGDSIPCTIDFLEVLEESDLYEHPMLAKRTSQFAFIIITQLFAKTGSRRKKSCVPQPQPSEKGLVAAFMRPKRVSALIRRAAGASIFQLAKAPQMTQIPHKESEPDGAHRTDMHIQQFITFFFSFDCHFKSIYN